MCYSYYREKDAAAREDSATQTNITRETVKASPETSPEIAKQAEVKAAARFMARVRQWVAGGDQKQEEVY